MKARCIIKRDEVGCSALRGRSIAWIPPHWGSRVMRLLRSGMEGEKPFD